MKVVDNLFPYEKVETDWKLLCGKNSYEELKFNYSETYSNHGKRIFN